MVNDWLRMGCFLVPIFMPNHCWSWYSSSTFINSKSWFTNNWWVINHMVHMVIKPTRWILQEAMKWKYICNQEEHTQGGWQSTIRHHSPLSLISHYQHFPLYQASTKHDLLFTIDDHGHQSWSPSQPKPSTADAELVDHPTLHPPKSRRSSHIRK